MPYYDKIAKQWHKVTGFKGGAFKSLILNDILLDKIGSVAGLDILELGAGNGYFLPMVLQRYSGQQSGQIIVSDVSTMQLKVAQQFFRIPGAAYQQLDIYQFFPFPDTCLDLILATMVFNELRDKGFINGIKESYRVLKPGGRLLLTTLHPQFVLHQIRSGVIRFGKMKGSGGLSLPVCHRPLEEYLRQFEDAGFSISQENVYGNAKLYQQKPMLRKLQEVPIGLIFTLTKRHHRLPDNLILTEH